MSSDDRNGSADDLYLQRSGTHGMRIEDGKLYPDFQLSTNPASNIEQESPGYAIKEFDIFGGDKEKVLIPEMDFRKLSNISSTTYITHGIHKHPAVFIPQIPDYLINTFTSEQNRDGNRPLVLDPFNGSGTSGIESKVAGRDYLGIEINPLSKLVSEVSTTPIPPSVLRDVEYEIVDRLAKTEDRVYTEYDVTFPGRTQKEHWFEQRAVRDLTRIRKVVSEYIDEDRIHFDSLTETEDSILRDLATKEADLAGMVNRWLVLMIANTVFGVSNADPKVSKAHKSSTMREKIDAGEHPEKRILQLYATHLHQSREKLLDLWEKIYDKREYADSTDGAVSQSILRENRAHKAEVDIRLGDARTFDVRDEKRLADLALTSPPYINAINYYRGTKLRLFWISDLLEDYFDATQLRQSMVGTNSAQISNTNRELPASIRDIWTGTTEEYEKTSLTTLDEDIRAIHEGALSEAKRRAFTTWRFFAEDMLQSICRTYEHLKPGAYFFLIIGENTIGGRHIQSHKFVADIAKNLGRFDSDISGAELDNPEGFRVVGIAIDEISTRDLFEHRNHRSGVIEHEWVVMLQKPSSSG
ncbi:site-specific DNA-methyltransferase [Salinirubellus salinus]|uniref:Site-specific DNA-methyltransferase n=1 Tax=Salinirubellus salinus TaxID=1364945 RepID=A0A9E7R4G2_9EURY|nr:site-specific DNA-methyltransferase [Salinirubellus salinus]UWM55198.1 site-specific DNA-methyltransferase [Salinirubellus salinus]